MKGSGQRIVPILQQTNRSHGPAQRVKAAQVKNDLSGPVGTNTNFFSPNWSGYLNLRGNSTFTSVDGYLIVPQVLAPIGSCIGETAFSFAWVSIDGQFSSDVLQTGVEANSNCAGGVTRSGYSIWYEWYPNSEVVVSNIPVSAGDEVFFQVFSTSPTQGVAFIVNESTKQYVSIGFSAPSGTSLVGDSAEWIAERTSINGSLPALANFTTITFLGANDKRANGVIDDLTAPIPIEMLDNAGNVAAIPELTGTNSFIVNTVGSVRGNVPF